MPCENENGPVSMFVFLPGSTPTAIDDLSENLTPEILNDVSSGALIRTRDMFVGFPKFSLETESDLKPVS